MTGNRLPYESTAGLAACGTPISRSELQPGDIVLHTGTDAHVIMFLRWTADGKIQLDLWYSGGKTAVNVFQDIVDAFNESQDKYEVKTTTQADYTETYEKLQAGIAGKKGFCSINIEKSMMNSEIGFGRKVLQVFEDQGISFEHIPSGIDTLTVYVHQDEFEEKEQQVIAGIHRLVQPDFVEMESDLALIAVVGRGMKSTRGTAGRIFSALAHANINVKMIDQGSSELNIIIGVENRDFENAVKAIYDIFVLTQI